MTTPPIATLTGWSVGRDEQNRPTVTLHLSADEARAWAAFLLDAPTTDAAYHQSQSVDGLRGRPIGGSAPGADRLRGNGR